MENANADSNDFRKDPKLLYDFLSAEIEHIKSLDKRAGWTTWALIAALATLVWTTLDFINKNIISYNHLACYLVLTLFGEKLLILLKSLINRGPKTKSNTFYIISNEYFRYNRIHLAYLLIVEIVIIYLVFSLNYEIFNKIIIAIIVARSIVILFIYIGLLRSTYKEPVMPSIISKINFNLIRYDIIYLILFILIIFVLISNITTSEYYDFNSMKFTLMIYGTHFILRTLSNEKLYSQYLYTLVELRRSLVLKNVNINSIIEQTNIVLYGFKIKK